MSDQNAEDDQPILMIKKRNVKGKADTRRTTTVQSDETGDDASSVSKLENTKLLQKLRAKTRGVSTFDDDSGEVSLVSDNPQQKSDTTRRLDDFQSEDIHQKTVEKAKEAFINEQIARMRQGLDPQVSTSQSGAPSSNASESRGTLTSSAIDENERGERWLAGISEVILPVEEKLSNIERTERAKKEMIAKKEQQLRAEAELDECTCYY